MNKQETAKILTYACADHGVHVTEEKLAVWHDQLKHHDYETVRQAARVVVSRKSYGTPKVSDVIDAIKELSAIDESAAWSLLLTACCKFGRHRKAAALDYVALSCPIVAEVASGFFAEVCDSETSAMATIRAQFWRALRSAVERHTLQRRQRDKPQLAGPVKEITDNLFLQLVIKREQEARNAKANG